jgi:hypothetical protein
MDEQTDNDDQSIYVVQLEVRLHIFLVEYVFNLFPFLYLLSYDSESKRICN